jgi:predicted HicB family RNase H-like nuclease
MYVQLLLELCPTALKGPNLKSSGTLFLRVARSGSRACARALRFS